MANDELTCVFWDVQHGSATYVNTPSNEHIVVDLGVGSYHGVGSYPRVGRQFSPLLHLKRRYGVQQLDGVVITHPHRDHIDDIDNFHELAPRVLVRPSHLSDADVRRGNRSQDRQVVEQYLRISAEYDQPVNPEESPFRQPRSAGHTIRTFTPTSCARSNLNNHSVVTVITYAGMKLLLPGDNESPSWEELLARRDFLDAIDGTDILLASHHGRESGFCPALFDYIEPRLTVISDGRFCDTSATARYVAVTRGWTVYHRNGRSEQRKCLTTRHDGVIVVECYSRGSQRILNVTID
jgi:beta-lactamase superfamily II metal-dependent hydrolase